MKMHWSVWGCILPTGLLLLLAVTAAVLIIVFVPESRIPDYFTNLEKQVNERMEEVRRQEAQKKAYDPDTTMEAIYAMELAMENAKTFEELTEKYVMQQSSDLISPDVQMLKYRFFNVYKNLLHEKDALADQQNIYKTASDIALEIFSTIDLTSRTVNRAQAEKIYLTRLEESKLKKAQKARLHAAQEEFLDFVFDFMAVTAKHYREWDQLCSVRDRAYLAVYEGNWDEAIAKASEAIEIAPHETEAHAILMMALLERGGELDSARAGELLKNFRERHPVNAAGLLLSGVNNMKNSNLEQAVLDFDQAAAYFPRLQETVNNRMNLYRKRIFLNQSKEGRVIVNAYRAMMSGSGYFSPDFQRARIHLTVGETDAAKEKIFDHFFRRRQQGEWDKVLDDFNFSSKALNTDLFSITAGNANIHIEIDEAFFTNSVVLKITNRGTAPLKNITVLLCVRFTDMFKNDYISFPVGETVSVLRPQETVSIGRKNISQLTEDRFGMKKKFKDIVEYAAVVISDEAILWIESKSPGDILPDPEDGSGHKETNSEKLRKTVDGLTSKASDIASETIGKTLDKVSEITRSSNESQNQKSAEDDPKN